MKQTEELMLTLDDVSGTLYERMLASAIEKQADSFRVMRSLVNINTDLVNTAGVEILVPKRIALDATVVSEGASLTLQTPSYDSVSIKVQIYGAAVEIGEETVAASQYNLINDALENLALAIAQKEDVDLVTALIDRTEAGILSTTTASSTGTDVTFNLSNGNVLTINEVISDGTTLTAYSVNYKNGRIDITTAMSAEGILTVDYAYAASVTCIAPTVAGAIEYADLISARMQVIINKFRPDTVLVSPYQHADLLKDSNLVDTSKYGSNETVMNGEIGKVAGMRVIVSNNMPDGVVAVFDS